ncbi:MAG TPA: riboflavin synthase [Syntrophomonadaceae bacterium]|nr:riboflavin synthase [Syntrophomonadaceae bacterium]
MFTGIIEELGRVLRLKTGGPSGQISVQAQKILEDVKLGDSIAVNGVCLTVVEFDKSSFTADVMPETIAKTTLRLLKHGDPVNLERALRLSDRLGGHLVQGHVDAVGSIALKEKLDIAIIYRIKAPTSLLTFIVPKGSIAVDGISLTVVDVFPDSFTVSLIPHSAQQTVLGSKNTGDMVNLESDIIGRYVERLMKHESGGQESAVNINFLAENGFV